MMQKFRNEQGITIVENLVAIVIFAIAVVGATSLYISAFHSNAAARTYTGMVADVEALVDGYRQGNFTTLLANFGGSASAITNGQVAHLTTTSSRGRATIATTLTAIKESESTIPEAVRVSIVATQRRGLLGNQGYSFETIVSQVK